MRADPQFENYRIYWSRCEGDGWSEPAEVPFAASKGVLEADPFVAPDGRHLYFSSSRADPTGNDLDVWVVHRLENGSWGQPERLPPPVNSNRPELLPRLTVDNRLYFGSSRDGGYGQGDIYVATPENGGTWTVANVGPPVSTAANEYEAEISRDGKHLAVVADRGERSHIYLFDLIEQRWHEVGRVRANDAVFQVGPLFAPTADRLLFAQRDGRRSGEWFLLDLTTKPRRDWPPDCANRRGDLSPRDTVHDHVGRR